jgi:predicted ester cyclase
VAVEDNKVDENKALLRRVIKEAHTKGDLAAVDEIYASDYVLRTPVFPTGEIIRGPEGIKRLISRQHAATPRLEFTIEDQIAEGDKVVTRYTASGTHWSGGIVISRIADRKIVEEWIYSAPGSEFQ